LFAAIDCGLEKLYRLCGLIAAVLLATLTALVLLSILTRFFDTFIAGLTEYAGYTMAASSFFAMAYTFRSGGHIRVQLLISNLPPGARRISDLWCLAVFALITSYLAYYLIELAWESWAFGEISEGGDALPLWIPQTPTAIGAGIFALSAIHSFIKALFDPSVMQEIDSGAGAEQ
jgi:TRAP-type C4-dicarboxylate transport system permease small subunit